jgi:hypothetical protein
MTRERTLTIKLVVMLSLNTYRKVKTTGLIMVSVRNVSTKKLYIRLESTV